MKPIPAILFAATLATFAAVPVSAGDLGPDKAIELVEQGTIKHFRDLNKIALDLHPGATIVDTELEDEYGKHVYKLELRDTNNVEWDVAIDAQSGAVLKNRQDNDD
ncbi:MAG: PepSY domain-containing protein [Porticoccaceae bacterium]|jgi:uncharacterized membrane protein YkoI